MLVFNNKKIKSVHLYEKTYPYLSIWKSYNPIYKGNKLVFKPQGYGIYIINAVTGTFHYLPNDEKQDVYIDVEANVSTFIEMDKNAISMNGCFMQCRNLKSIDFDGFNWNKVRYVSYFFSQCDILEYINFGNLGKPQFSYSANMFEDSNNIKHIKCKQDFKDWCIANQDVIKLPNTMREGGTGTWEIID